MCKVCLVIAFVACSALEDVLSVWAEVWVIQTLSALSDGSPISEGQTLKCQQFLRLQVWLTVIRRTTWDNAEWAEAIIECIEKTIHTSLCHLFP